MYWRCRLCVTVIKYDLPRFLYVAPLGCSSLNYGCWALGKVWRVPSRAINAHVPLG